MVSMPSTNLNLRQGALALLEKLYQAGRKELYFQYGGSTYEYLGTNADGTIQAVNLSTNQVSNAMDPTVILNHPSTSAYDATAGSDNSSSLNTLKPLTPDAAPSATIPQADIPTPDLSIPAPRSVSDLMTSTPQDATNTLQSLFQNSSGETIFNFNNSTFKFLGSNADGTIQALNLTTNLVVNSMDPVSVLNHVLSRLSPSDGNSPSINGQRAMATATGAIISPLSPDVTTSDFQTATTPVVTTDTTTTQPVSAPAVASPAPAAPAASTPPAPAKLSPAAAAAEAAAAAPWTTADGTLIHDTSAERSTALQQLQSAYGNPNGNLVFTYNGNVYNLLGVNSDNTMQVQNINTGQIITNLDPVRVYADARAAAGNPLPPPPTPKPPTNILANIATYGGMVTTLAQLTKLGIGAFASTGGMAHTALGTPSLDLFGSGNFASTLTKIFSKGLAVAGIVLGSISIVKGINTMFTTGKGILLGSANVAMSALGIATGVNALLGIHGFMATLTNPAGWVAAGLVIATAIDFNLISNMVTNGPTVGGVIGAAAATVAIAIAATYLAWYVGLISLYEGFLPLLTNPVGWIIAGAVVLFSVFWALTHQPDEFQVKAGDLTQALTPIIWTAGPVVGVGLGTVALLLGLPQGQQNVMSTLTVPAYYLAQTLMNTGSSANIPLNSKTPTTLIEPGKSKTDPEKVMIVSNNGQVDQYGNPMVTIQSFVLFKNLQFISSLTAPQGTYIPFFLTNAQGVKPQYNPDVVQGMKTQQSMLSAVLSGNLNTASAQSAVLVASAADKYGANPTNN